MFDLFEKNVLGTNALDYFASDTSVATDASDICAWVTPVLSVMPVTQLMPLTQLMQVTSEHHYGQSYSDASEPVNQWASEPMSQWRQWASDASEPVTPVKPVTPVTPVRQ